MTIKDWFNKRKELQIAHRELEEAQIDDSIGKLWIKCYNCNAQLLKKDVEDNLDVCPQCNYHFRINSEKRIQQLFDEGSFKEMFTDVLPTDPLNFEDTETYKNRLKSAKEKTNLNEAVKCGEAKIDGERVSAAVMDFEYMGGSMGSVVGEKITRAMEYALQEKIPMIAVTASGGARMQESALSLMQMAKTSCAVARLNEAGLLYITVLTEPTFGGVTASFATLGDIIIAEQGARIGFAGRRVIEQTIKQSLPSDFQTAEYLMKYGQIDILSTRKDLKATISNLLKLHKPYVVKEETVKKVKEVSEKKTTTAKKKTVSKKKKVKVEA
ncbi:MAG: acetyl-CoA carboxylase, carboxyltransferase subunit beta [Candidatus Gastranaerophilales bacterium]|nr:acetyl-CoA carboxylase, carboxyltransferase subunit beta [Candidatus Gastranaerophilales bacterium]